jgi:hypothetical protein
VPARASLESAAQYASEGKRYGLLVFRPSRNTWLKANGTFASILVRMYANRILVCLFGLLLASKAVPCWHVDALESTRAAGKLRGCHMSRVLHHGRELSLLLLLVGLLAACVGVVVLACFDSIRSPRAVAAACRRGSRAGFCYRSGGVACRRVICGVGLCFGGLLGAYLEGCG